MEGNSSYPENHRKKFSEKLHVILKERVNSSESGEAVKNFFYLLMIMLHCILLASLKCEEMTECVCGDQYMMPAIT